MFGLDIAFFDVIKNKYYAWQLKNKNGKFISQNKQRRTFRLLFYHDIILPQQEVQYLLLLRQDQAM